MLLFAFWTLVPEHAERLLWLQKTAVLANTEKIPAFERSVRDSLWIIDTAKNSNPCMGSVLLASDSQDIPSKQVVTGEKNPLRKFRCN